jgi:nitrogen regulatory protein P-II 2
VSANAITAKCLDAALQPVDVFDPARRELLHHRQDASARTQSESERMKYIIAVIQPHRLDMVREALAAIGVQGLTVTEVRGFGRQKGQTEVYRGAEYTVQYVPKAKLEIAVDDGLADQVVETISEAARTGHIGDGKIFVLDLEGVMRVRTGEMGADAL